MAIEENRLLFPEFEQFVKKTELLTKAKGIISAKLPRILGQGRTKAIGLDLPPAAIERKMELAGLLIPEGISIPDGVRAEIEKIKAEVDNEISVLSTEDGIRRFIAQVMKELPEPKAFKDNRYVSCGLILQKEDKNSRFSWCITSHHPIIKHIPPDVEYVIRAHQEAEKLLLALDEGPESFGKQFDLAYAMARHFNKSNDVLVTDISRLYKVAKQADRFWNNPVKQYFVDIPDASFVAGLRSWNRSGGPSRNGYDFIPATLAQEPRAYYLPTNEEGTVSRPFIFVRKKISN